MMYDFSFVNIADIVQALFLFIGVYCCSITLKSLGKKKYQKDEVMKIKRRVFAWLSIGVTALAIATLSKVVLKIFNMYSYPSFADFFFIISYSCLAIGFDYLWYKTAKMHRFHIKEPFFVIGVFCTVFIWLYYLFITAIIPGSANSSIEVVALNYFYPVIISAVFLLTLAVHPRLKANIIRTPLWYISSGVFVYYLGYMMYSYYVWRPFNDILPAIYSALFFLSSLYFLLGFYTAMKKYN